MRSKWIPALYLFCGLSAASCGAPQSETAPCVVSATPPALTLITPESAFVARTLTVQIAGTDTHFGPSTQVDFDDSEIKTQVVVRSRENLLVQLTIGAEARLGPHNVVVSSQHGSEREVVNFSAGLTVRPSLQVGGIQERSRPQQGGLFEVTLHNLDYKDSPFNPNQIQGADGSRWLRVQSASGARLTVLSLVDVLSHGALSLRLRSQNPLSQDVLYISAADDALAPWVELRPAVSLEPATILRGQSFSRPFQTQLYQFEAGAAEQVVQLSFSSVGLALQSLPPVVATAPSSGRFSEGTLVPQPTQVGTTMTSLYLKKKPGRDYLAMFPSDYSGDSEYYGYELTARAHPAQSFSLREPTSGDSTSNPIGRLVLDRAAFSQDGAIETSSDADYLLVDVPSTGRLYVQAAGTPTLSTRTAIFQRDCTTMVMPQRTYQQEAAVLAGTYCVRITGATSTGYQFLALFNAQP